MLPLRSLRLLSVICLSAWFTLVVPAHERGQIRVPGAAGESTAVCGPGSTEKTCCPTDSEKDEPSPSEDPVQHCAVCELVAKLSTPDALALPLPPSAPLQDSFVANPINPPLAPASRSSQPRAPPAHL